LSHWDKVMAETNNDVPRPGVSRRELFHVLGTVPALAAATAASGLTQTRHDHPTAAPHPAADPHAGAYQRKVFDEHQWHTVRVLSDLIIPADERSGSATEAGVPEFIDDWLDFRNREDGNENFAAGILGGLAWLDREAMQLGGKSFADAAPAQQTQILDRIAWPERAAAELHPWVVFFNKFRDLTASGFFSSKTGIRDLPYLGNTVVEEWKGCDPEVWAKIEERMKTGYKGVGGEAKPWTS
jgi:gluconate 2-dehydrogenase gamma chain